MDSVLLKLREEMNQQNRDLNNYIEKLKQEAFYASEERNKAYQELNNIKNYINYQNN